MVEVLVFQLFVIQGCIIHWYDYNSGSYDRKNTVVDTRDTEPTRPSVSAFDCDEDKYRRRSLREWLTRWFRLNLLL